MNSVTQSYKKPAFIRTKIANFVESEELDISVVGPFLEADIPALVQLSQRAGSVHFLHAMTADQAREMAAVLIEAADSLDAAA